MKKKDGEPRHIVHEEKARVGPERKKRFRRKENGVGPSKTREKSETGHCACHSIKAWKTLEEQKT